MQKSLGKNSVLNAIKALMAVIFPLITTPYVTSILGVDNVGRYSFSYTFVTYFLLIASLGINNYAIREGAAFRDNKEELGVFINEVFSINIISTIVSYVLLVACILSVSKFQEYWQLILILSAQIGFTTLGVEWIYSIFEDYFYITVRSILFQLLSILLLVLLVKTEDDVNMYAWVTVISSVGANVWNLVKSRKYCRVRFTFKLNIKKHIVPILYIFASNAAVVIYVSSDNTILGFMTSDYNVGLYSLATKIYRATKTMLSAFIVVSIPRLSYYVGKNKMDDYNVTLSKLFRLIVSFAFPIMTGIILLSQEIILLLSNSDYIESKDSVIFLSIALLFCMLSYIYGQCILMPLKLEKITMYATILSSIVNVILNFILIPVLQQNGAAITTIIAEAMVFIFYWIYIHNKIKIQGAFETIIKTIIGCFFIALSCLAVKKYVESYVFRIVLSVFISALFYFIVEIILKNKAVMELVHSVRKFIRRRK